MPNTNTLDQFVRSESRTESQSIKMDSNPDPPCPWPGTDLFASLDGKVYNQFGTPVNGVGI